MPKSRKYSIKFLQDSLATYSEHLENLSVYTVVNLVTKEQYDKIREIDTEGLLNEDMVHLNIMNVSILHFQGFLLVSILDTIVVLKNALITTDKWEKIFYLRHGSMIIYEALNTYNKHSKILNQVVENRYTELKSSFGEITKKIRKFKKDFKYESLIANLRHNTTAHINADFLQYCKFVSSIEQDEIIYSFFEFFNIFSHLISFVVEILQQITRDSFNIIKALNIVDKSYEEYCTEVLNKDHWFDTLLLQAPKMLK